MDWVLQIMASERSSLMIFPRIPPNLTSETIKYRNYKSVK